MKLLTRLPAREIEGADQVLEGAAVEMASGNQCRIWPAMTYDPGTFQTRIAFFTEWRRPPTPEDQGELIAYTDSMMGKSPAIVRESPSDPRTDTENLDWLRAGKQPKPNKTN